MQKQLGGLMLVWHEHPERIKDSVSAVTPLGHTWRAFAYGITWYRYFVGAIIYRLVAI